MTEPHVFSVSEFTGLVKDTLGQTFGRVIVEGEVTGYRQRQSGNKLVFFEIKDEASRVTIFMLDYELDVELEDGMTVRVIGSPSLFKKNSGFHLRAIRVQPVGAGALAKALALLKEKLEREGLFDPGRKRTIPTFPERIALITSPDAAAYTDVIRVLRQRWPLATVVFIPAQVQGDAAAGTIVKAFQTLKTMTDIDAVILTRGGGSLEDLQSFNAEPVARAIFASSQPVVVGVGHERDWTIADLVADVRGATPSNAAELTTPDRAEIIGVVSSFERVVFRGMANADEAYRRRYQHALTLLLRGPQRWHVRFRQATRILAAQFGQMVHQQRTYVSDLSRMTHRLHTEISVLITRTTELINQQLRTIKALSPEATLQRGYSITLGPDGRPVRSAATIHPDDQLQTRLASGSITSTVTHTHD